MGVSMVSQGFFRGVSRLIYLKKYFSSSKTDNVRAFSDKSLKLSINIYQKGVMGGKFVIYESSTQKGFRILDCLEFNKTWKKREI